MGNYKAMGIEPGPKRVIATTGIFTLGAGAVGALMHGMTGGKYGKGATLGMVAGSYAISAAVAGFCDYAYFTMGEGRASFGDEEGTKIRRLTSFSTASTNTPDYAAATKKYLASMPREACPDGPALFSNPIRHQK